MVKGILDHTMITLVNIQYLCHLRAIKKKFQALIWLYAEEIEGVCICGGDLDAIMDYDLDTTGHKRHEKSLTKLAKNTGKKWDSLMFGQTFIPCKETALTNQVPTHTTRELVILYAERKHNIWKCHIGVSAVSDHNVIYLKMHLNCRRKTTFWKLKAGLLNKVGGGRNWNWYTELFEGKW